MLPVRLHPEEASEALEAADWYESRQEGLGMDFLAELDRSCRLLAETPMVWPLYPGVRGSLAIRRFLLSRFPYALAYDVFKDEIVVYAAAHLSRRPGYWRDRLRT